MATPLVVFGIPSYGALAAQWVMALRSLNMPLGAATSDMWMLGDEMPIADKRNLIARNAVNMGAKYVLFIGDDTLPPPHTFIQLHRQAVNTGAKIITGLYTSRSNPPMPMIWKDYMQGPFYDFHLGDFFEVDWAGCDLLLIDVEVFRAVPEPWFSQDYVFEPNQPKPVSLATEDIYFYEKMRKHGFKAWCDTSVHGIHQDRNTGQQFGVPRDWPQAIPGSEIAGRDATHLVADLGAGPESRYTSGTLVRFDIDPTQHPDVLCDIRAIPEPDQKYDEVWGSHILEHFMRADAPAAMREWSRILKIGGQITITVPNFGDAIERIAKGAPHVTEYNWWQVYGRQASPYDVHYNGFTVKTLRGLLELAWGDAPIHAIDAEGELADGVGCYEDIKVEVGGPSGENLIATARKVRHPKPAVLGPAGRFATEDKDTREPTVMDAAQAVVAFAHALQQNRIGQTEEELLKL